MPRLSVDVAVAQIDTSMNGALDAKKAKVRYRKRFKFINQTTAQNNGTRSGAYVF